MNSHAVQMELPPVNPVQSIRQSEENHPVWLLASPRRTQDRSRRYLGGRQHGQIRRHRQPQQSLSSWLWLKLCCHVRKVTIQFFEAVDASRADAVRNMIQLNPALLLRTRPGTRWTAAHYAAERGDFSTVVVLFEESQALDERCLGANEVCDACACLGGRVSDYTTCMVNALTEKNLTPLMLACKRGG